MYKVTIDDTRIRVRPSKKLLDVLGAHLHHISEMPENVADILMKNKLTVPKTIKIVTDTMQIEKPTIDTSLLKDLSEATNEEPTNPKHSANKEDVHDSDLDKAESYLYFNDLKWLFKLLTKLRQEHGSDVFLHDVVEKSYLVLPENKLVERNPELEARCKKLLEQQQNLEYYKMTKHVDAALKYYPEDTVAFQLKAINSQIIAVLQFVVSVIAGFAFGFVGIQWIVGNLDFGFRLLLGIMCGLVIALAEMYFLAKKLVEYDSAVDSKISKGPPKRNQKMHKD